MSRCSRVDGISSKKQERSDHSSIVVPRPRSLPQRHILGVPPIAETPTREYWLVETTSRIFEMCELGFDGKYQLVEPIGRSYRSCVLPGLYFQHQGVENLEYPKTPYLVQQMARAHRKKAPLNPQAAFVR